MVQHVFGPESRVLVRLDRDGDALTQARVGEAHDGTVGDTGQGADHPLDLCGVHVRPASQDQIVPPVLREEEPVLDGAEITRAQDPVDEGVGRWPPVAANIPSMGR